MQYNQKHQALPCPKAGNLLFVLDAAVSLAFLLNNQWVYCTDIKPQGQRVMACNVLLPDYIY